MLSKFKKLKEKVKGKNSAARNQKSRFLIRPASFCLVIAMLLGIIVAFLSNGNRDSKMISYDPELARAMTYQRVDEEENPDATDSDYVKFDAFFLRDIDGDGEADGIRGTCKEIGEQDTLYMELKVNTNGKLINGKIEIIGDNFYLDTAIPKDDQVLNNYIGTNTRTILLDEIGIGTQKLLTGAVKSGDYSYTSGKTLAIGNNKSRYSGINTVRLTGIHIADDGETTTEIKKEVNFNVDWYGELSAQIVTNTDDNTYDLTNAIKEENDELNLSFYIQTREIKEQLILKKNVVTGEIPQLNGYKPTNVTINNGTYDPATRKFTIEKSAVEGEGGKITSTISRTSSYNVKVTYPLDAYRTLGRDTVEIRIPVETYYEGYNNENTEFNELRISNTAKSTVVITFRKPSLKDGDILNGAGFEVIIGKYSYSPNKRYYVSKEKPLNIYNEISNEETGDKYTVLWKGHRLTEVQTGGMTMKETENEKSQVSDEFIKTSGSNESMEDLTANIGIYFSGQLGILGEDGWIKVYDDTTNELLETFTKENWNKYSESNPYKYKIPVKHIRVETSVTKTGTLYVYNIKELDDEKITTKYSKEEFDELQYIKSTLAGYIGSQKIETTTSNAYYEAPISLLDFNIIPTAISNQITEDVKIKITTQTYESYHEEKWSNGSFLLKLPSQIIDAEIKNVTASNNVTVTSYETYEENGERFIKILTSNETPATFTLTIDTELTPDPRAATVLSNIELYASNENCPYYYNSSSDKYDVNGNLNKTEQVYRSTASINIVAPNSLLTSQVAREYDENGSTAVAPQIALVEKNQNKATIDVEIKNNYSNTITDIVILGKIPTTGNNYCINGSSLNSEFDTTMKADGIQIPSALQSYAKIYYSVEINPDKDNGNWIEDPSNWEDIKSYKIELGEYRMPKNTTHKFTYEIEIPGNLDYNQVSYGHHAVYFSLNTDQGKYKTHTEPNKLGLMIAKQYNLELTKYQKDTSAEVQGAIYSIREEGESEEEGRTRITGTDGKLTLNKLLAEKTYIIKEIKSPDQYELNKGEIKFKTTVDSSGKLIANVESGTVKQGTTIEVIKGTDGTYTVQISVEDEVRPNIKIVKTEQGTGKEVSKVRFKITGKGLPESGKTLTTNSNGEANLTGLYINENYTLEEVKADGYYLGRSFTFKIQNNSGIYSVEGVDSTLPTTDVQTLENIPTIKFDIENEKIPTYNLEITKIEKDNPKKVLEGAKFKLIYEEKEIGVYESDPQGKIEIKDLYQYVDGRDVSGTYTLKEILAPEGYAKVKDIIFTVRKDEDTLIFEEKLEAGQTAKEWKVSESQDTIQLIIPDSPSFKLTKQDGTTYIPLPGVKFAIYNIDDKETPATDSKGNIIGEKEIINGKEYYIVKTNGNGEIAADLKEGLYKAVEVEAEDKYDINKNVYYFGIGASKEVEKTLEFDWAKISETNSSTSKENFEDSDYVLRIVQIKDGSYIGIGYFYDESITIKGQTYINNYYDSIEKDNKQIFIIKYNENKEVDSVTTLFGGNYDNGLNSVIATSDGGYIVVGFFRGNITVGDYALTSSGQNGLIIKYDENDEIEWIDTNSIYYPTITEMREGGYLVAGHLDNDNFIIGDQLFKFEKEYGAIIVQYDEDGNVEKVIPFGQGEMYCADIILTSDGGYIVLGDINGGSIEVGERLLHPTSSWSDGFLIKFNANGDMEWADIFQGYGEGDTFMNSIAEVSDRGYILTGSFSTSSVTIGDTKLNNNGYNNEYSYDALIVKYSNNGEIEWVESFGGSGNDYASSIETTSDGGCIISGTFSSESITIGGQTLTREGSSSTVLIKYTPKEIPNLVVKQATVIGGNGDDAIKTVTATSDGGYIVGGYFEESITIGDEKIVSQGLKDGLLIKYDANGDVEWATSVRGISTVVITSVAQTSDSGYVVGGYCQGNSIITVGDEILTNNGSPYGWCGIIIKYDNNGDVEWAKSIGNSDGFSVNSVAATRDGGCIVGGTGWIDHLEIDGKKITDYGDEDGLIIKYKEDGEVEWVTSFGGEQDDGITSVAETRDGGYIVGGYFGPGSIILGKETFTNSGNSWMDYNGLIIKYSTNGEVEWATSFEGSSTNRVTSVVETKEGDYIVGGIFGLGSITIGNKTFTNSGISGSYDGLIIKYDANGEVEWVTSVGGNSYDYIYSVAETNDGGYIVGGYCVGKITVGEIILNCDIHNCDGVIIKYDANGKVEWATSFGGIDEEGVYSVAVTSEGDYIIVGDTDSSPIIIEGTTLNKNDYSWDGFIIKIAEEKGVQELKELVVNNYLKEFKITTEVKSIDGQKGGNISGEGSKSYEKVKWHEPNTNEIKMTPYENYELVSVTVNGEEYDLDDLILKDGSYNMKPFENIEEDKHIVVTYIKTSNKVTITKLDKDTETPLAGAKFKIERTDGGATYTAEVETNSDGQAIIQLEFGNYKVTEIKAPDDYELNEEELNIEVTDGGNNQFEFRNEKSGKVIVHHYNKETLEPVALDEEQTGKVGTNYKTQPHLDLQEYELEMEQQSDGSYEYKVPDNATGQFKKDDEEVTYYYVKRKIPLTVHHYIENTENPVPMEDGSDAKDDTYKGDENAPYTTTEKSGIDPKYELVKEPENKEGVYKRDEVIVTYYYRLKSYEITTEVKLHDETDKLGKVSQVRGGSISGEEDNPYEIVEVGGTSEEEITIEADSEYQIKSITIESTDDNGETTQTSIQIDGRETIKTLEPITNITADKHIIVEFEKFKGTVTVHHYIKDKENEHVLLQNGEEAPDEEKIGYVGEIYATQPVSDLHPGYEFVEVTGEASGEFIDDNIDVIYYYKARTDLSYTVKYLEKDTELEVATSKTEDGQTYQTTVTENAIDVVGYNKVDPTTKTITIDVENNEIKFYYTKRTDLKYTVEFYYNGNKADEKTKEYNNQTFKTVIERENISGIIAENKVDGYRLATDEEIKTLDGMENVTVDNGVVGVPLTIGVDEENNVIKVFYVTDDGQTKELKYTVEYYKDGEKADTDEAKKTVQLLASNTLEVDKSKINVVDKYPGYRFESVNPDPIPDTVENGDTIKVYYVKRTDLSYTVKYLEKYTGLEVATDKNVDGQTYQAEVTENAIDVAGYNKVDPTTKTITIDVENNEIKFYYTKRTDLSYTVKYLEKDTELDVAQSKTVDGQTYQAEVTENAIDVVGYNKVNPTTKTITIDVENNEIKFYYTKRNDLSYTVYYLERIEDREVEIANSKEVSGKTYKETVTETAIEIEGYVKPETETESIEIGTGTNEIKFYYTRRSDLKYTVEFYYNGNKETEKTKEYNNQTFKTVIERANLDEIIEENKTDGYRLATEEEIKALDGMEEAVVDNGVVGVPLSIGVEEDKNIIKVFYVPDDGNTKTLKYTVEYYKDGSIVAEDTYEGKATVQKLQPDTIEVNKEKIEEEKYEGYEIEKITITYPSREETTIEKEDIPERVQTETVIKVYYTKRTDLSYTVKYLEKDTELNVAQSKTVDGQTYQAEVTENAIDVAGYNKEDPTTKTITIKVEGNEIKFYYTKRTDLSYTVKYLEKDTELDVAQSKTVDGQTYQAEVTENAIDVAGYNKEDPTTKTITIDVENNEIKFYYTKRTDLSYTVKYLEKDTELDVAQSKTVDSQTYQAEVTENAIDVAGYNKEDPTTKTITIDLENNEIKFYYTKRSDLKYTVEFYYNGNKETEKTKEYNNQTFKTVIERANLDEIIEENKTDGYRLATEEEIKALDGMEEAVVDNGVVGVPLSIGVEEDKNIIKVFYVPDDGNTKTLKYTVEYYKDGSIVAEDTYEGKATVQKLQPDTIEVNKEKIEEEKYEGYEIEEITITYPSEEETTIEKEDIPERVQTETVIKVYYTKRTDLSYTVKYLEKDTELDVAQSKTVDGQTYQAEVTENAIDVAGYNKVDPTTKTITINVENNEIIFYYTKKDAQVIVHHYIKDTTDKVPSKDGKVVEDEIIEGKIGDTYETEKSSQVSPNYEYVSRTENYFGTMKEKPIEVTYYYELVDAQINPSITKTATEKITKENDEITYVISYIANVDKYIGNATVIIVDYLPYEIDESKSDLAKGTYDKNTNTITWTEEETGIDTYTNGPKDIIINKTIKVVYKNQDVTRNIVNKAEGTVILPVTGQEEKTDPQAQAETEQEYKVDVKVNKVWEDNQTQAARRPEKIKIELLANGQVVQCQEITAAEDTSCTFLGLDKYDENGEEIVYTVQEKEVNDGELYFYINSVDDRDMLNQTITNTFTRPNDRIEIEAIKIWEDENNENGRRPESVTLLLKDEKGNTLRSVVTEDDEWKHNFINLDKYDENGQEKVYVVDEEEVNQGDLHLYAKEINNQTYTITNTFTVLEDQIEVTVNKVWEDNDDKYGKRPENIKVTLYGDKKEVQSTIISEAEDWTYTFTNLRKYDIQTGKDIDYTIKEDEVEEGGLFFYQSEINSEDMLNQTITNIFEVPDIEINITANKEWKDNNNIYGRRSKEIEIVLYSEQDIVDEETQETQEKVKQEVERVVVTEDENWEYTFTNLPKYNSVTGQEIKYTIEENEVNAGDLYFYKNSVDSADMLNQTIINTFTVPEDKIQVEVTKQWLEDNNNEYGTRPDGIVVVLFKDKEEIDRYTLTEKEEWKHTFTDLRKYDEVTGKEIEYSIAEEELKEGDFLYYETEIDNQDMLNQKVINTFMLANTKVEPQIIKEGTEKITKKDEELTYIVTYNTKIEDYIGNAQVTITDNLPYEIDEEKSSLAGGKYDAESKTITWTEEIENINTFTDGIKEINIEKGIIVVYKDIDPSKKTLTNKVEGKLFLDTTKKEDKVETQKETQVDLKFNLKAEKQITEILKNGKSESVSDSKMQKVSVHRKQIDTTSIKVKYEIKVTNTGSLIGEGIIEEDLPLDMIFIAEESDSRWYVEDGKVKAKIENMQPEEEITLKVATQWVGGDNAFGGLTNTVKITNTENEAGFEEERTDDNTDSATIIVEIATGGETYVMLSLGILLILTAIAGIVYKVKVTKKE